MATVFSIVAALLASLIRLLRPGGFRSLVAENIALRRQLLAVTRWRRRAPKLGPIGRLVLALSSLLIEGSRIHKIAVAVRPSTILRWHRLLVRRKYRSLFTPKSTTKPGPKGPSPEVRAAIVELKRRNPRFGCRRISQIVNRTFVTDIDKDVVRRVLKHYYRPDPR